MMGFARGLNPSCGLGIRVIPGLTRGVMDMEDLNGVVRDPIEYLVGIADQRYHTNAGASRRTARNFTATAQFMRRRPEYAFRRRALRPTAG